MNAKRKSVLKPKAPVEEEEEHSSSDDARGADFDPTQGMEEYLRRCVRIDPLDLHGEYARISGDLAYWNDQYARALRAYLMTAVDLKVLRAQLEPELRLRLIDEVGKTTEAQVKAAVEGDDRVIDAQRAHVEAEVKKNLLFGTLDAIRSKKEMLISMGAHVRAEMAGDPLIRDQHRHSRSIDDA